VNPAAAVAVTAVAVAVATNSIGKFHSGVRVNRTPLF